MRLLPLFPIALLIACGSSTSTESFAINGVPVTRAEFEARTGGGTTTPPQTGTTALTPAYASLADATAVLETANITSRPNSAFTGVPNAGTATFTGVTVVQTAGAPGLEFTASAETTLIANFANDTIVANPGTFLLLDSRLNPVAPLAGTVAFNDGTIGERRPNAVAMSASGNLSNATATMIVSGDLEGAFRATPIRGVTLGTGNALGIVNGVGSPRTVIAIEALID